MSHLLQQLKYLFPEVFLYERGLNCFEFASKGDDLSVE